MAKSKKIYKEVLEVAEANGWSLTGGGRKHFKLVPPPDTQGVPPIFFPATPGNDRGVKNFKSLFRRWNGVVDQIKARQEEPTTS